MGNFHCIPSDCARVVYREYLPPVIRWRYPEEKEWQEIEADDYAIEEEKGKCKVPYNFYWRFREAPDIAWKNRTAISTEVTKFFPPFENLLFYADDQSIGFDDGDFPIFETAYFQANRGRYIFKFKFDYTDLRGNRQTYDNSFGQSFRTNTARIEFIRFERADGLSDNCGDCVFTITKNGENVYTETRDICPEIEKLPCRLSEISKEIKIDKLSYLERVEVRNQAIETIFVSPLEAPFLDVSQLPEECLNIYRTGVTAPSLLSNYVPLPGVINPYQYQAQICSTPNCPPPEYTVICDCASCESCPDNTCPVECNGHVCCYDTSTGMAVKEIKISDYCGAAN